LTFRASEVKSLVPLTISSASSAPGCILYICEQGDFSVS
jgi:hypothetical protein